MGIEDWVLKGTKLITNRKAKMKNLEVNSQIYNIKKTKPCHKNYYIYIYVYIYIYTYIYIYMKFALKIGSFLQNNSRL